MAIDIDIYGEYWWKYWTDSWRDCLQSVKSQIELALEDAGFNPNVETITSVNPEAPKPYQMYDGANTDWWDKWLDEHNDRYAGDSTILVMEDKGGLTFNSGRNWNSTTDGVMTLVGGMDIQADYPTAGAGKPEHYHDMYNVLHELSHALDAPTGEDSIGDYWKDNGGDYHRTPGHTKYETWGCDSSSPAKASFDYWELTYTDCTASYLTDQ